jgi:hypothetical protein
MKASSHWIQAFAMFTMPFGTIKKMKEKTNLMEILTYNEMDPKGLSKQVNKVMSLLQAGEFSAADVKKLKGTRFYRAKLSSRDRLLFSLGRHNDSAFILLLEVIKNHAYEKSRFLKGARIDEDKIDFDLSSDKLPDENLTPLCYTITLLGRERAQSLLFP